MKARFAESRIPTPPQVIRWNAEAFALVAAEKRDAMVDDALKSLFETDEQTDARRAFEALVRDADEDLRYSRVFAADSTMYSSLNNRLLAEQNLQARDAIRAEMNDFFRNRAGVHSLLRSSLNNRLLSAQEGFVPLTLEERKARNRAIVTQAQAARNAAAVDALHTQYQREAQETRENEALSTNSPALSARRFPAATAKTAAN